MKAKKSGPSQKDRLKTGAAILAAAQVVEVTAIKPRLTAFASAHRDYVAAQRAVDAAETELQKGQAQVDRCDAEQDDRVEGLARALVTDGEPRANPFEAFHTGTPFAIKQLTPAEQAKTIRTLIGTVQESKTVSTATRRVARAAEQAVGAVEAALLTLEKRKAALRTARDTRTADGEMWDSALAALKRGARAAADDGAPGLYEALLGGLRRPRTKKATAAPVAAPVVTAPVVAPPAAPPAPAA